MAIKISCNNCRYANVQPISADLTRQIVCRRYPPQVFPHPNGLFTTFPVVNAEMSCGEFQPDRVETTLGILV